MKTYLVGGAVRDALLGLPPGERDWVVVGATPRAMLEAGYKQVGKDFPVFLHPQTKEEYALARLERKTAPGHRGFVFDSTGSVSLEDDLKRRDLSINAMAQDEDGNLIDPWGGRQDLEARLLRHVSAAFAEDPLRVLRVARFAACLAPLGFTVAPETMALMGRMSEEDDELATLPGERVWREMHLALQSPRPELFIQVLRDCGALGTLLPEVDALFGVPQPPQHHPEVDTGLHILLCLQQAAAMGADPVVRYGVLMHDLGKALTDPAAWPRHHGHERLGLKALKAVHGRIAVPKEYAQLAELVCEHHTTCHRALQLRPDTMLRLFDNLDAFRRPQRLSRFLLACEADARGRTGLETRPYPQAEHLRRAYEAAASVDGGALLKESPPKESPTKKSAKPHELIRQARLQRIRETVQAA